MNPDDLKDQADLIERCSNPTVTERFRQVLSRVDGVERTAVASTLVAAVLDPSVSNHWGYLTLVQASVTPGDALPQGTPIVVEGRVPDPAAPDEIAVSDDAARVAGLHAGDDVRMASWQQADLDAAIDGTVAPQTPPFRSKVVGIVRYLDQTHSRTAAAAWPTRSCPATPTSTRGRVGSPRTAPTSRDTAPARSCGCGEARRARARSSAR